MSGIRVHVKPSLLKWARERADLAPEELAEKVKLAPKRVIEWEDTGELALSHLEKIAEKTHTPIGYLFLSEPPAEPLPVADFRTGSGHRVGTASINLLDTLYQCELRQQWYREVVASEEGEALEFVGSAQRQESPQELAQRIRAKLGMTTARRASFATWAEALRHLYEQVEELGVLVMRNGIVGNNTHRKLDASEFRGFALSDRLAPLVFVNAADSKSAQMFTIAHELVHIWRGESGVSDADPRTRVPAERYCNQVAAEILIPTQDFVNAWSTADDPASEVQRLARTFKVSALVVLIRAMDSAVIDSALFHRLYDAELARSREPSSSSGGDFYRTQRSRLGRRFATAVIVSAVEGRTPYTEAFHLLGIKKAATFDELARNLGVLV